MFKGVCDTCRERRAWDKPGRTIMPSTALPGNCNEEVECDLMFYKQEHTIFLIIDRCIRYATGIEIPDKTMTSILSAYHQCWMQFGLAKVFYSDGGVPLTTTLRKQSSRRKNIEVRMRARGQPATTTEAKHDILRHLLHAMEAEPNRLDIPL
eukprot:4553915-Pyramimonas_sp.AAC.1